MVLLFFRYEFDFFSIFCHLWYCSIPCHFLDRVWSRQLPCGLDHFAVIVVLLHTGGVVIPILLTHEEQLSPVSRSFVVTLNRGYQSRRRRVFNQLCMGYLLFHMWWVYALVVGDGETLLCKIEFFFVGAKDEILLCAKKGVVLSASRVKRCMLQLLTPCATHQMWCGGNWRTQNFEDGCFWLHFRLCWEKNCSCQRRTGGASQLCPAGGVHGEGCASGVAFAMGVAITKICASLRKVRFSKVAKMGINVMLNPRRHSLCPGRGCIRRAMPAQDPVSTCKTTSQTNFPLR